MRTEVHTFFNINFACLSYQQINLSTCNWILEIEGISGLSFDIFTDIISDLLSEYPQPQMIPRWVPSRPMSLSCGGF